MRKVLLFVFFAPLSSFIADAQITITQQDMPNSGDTLRVSNSNDVIDPTVTDTACFYDGWIWDYSSLTPATQWVRKFDSPSTFTFPFNVLFNIVTTSYGEAQYTPDSIPILGIKPDDSYNFYKESSSKYKQLGTGLTINALPIPFSYNPHDTIYRFPLNCGDRDTSYAESGLALPGIGYYGQKINRVNFADGRGTLITPFGSFYSLRVRSIIALRDTFSDTTGAVAFAFDRPLSYEYKWLVKTGKIPYLTVTANDVGGVPVVSNIEYRDSLRGVPQVGIQEFSVSGLQFSVYPNPASEYALLQYELSSSAEIKIELYDISGRKIKSIVDSKQNSGKHIEVIPVKELSPKIYFVKISSGNQSVSRKLAVM